MLRREAKIICLVIERRNSDFWGDSKDTYSVSIHVWTLQGKLLRS